MEPRFGRDVMGKRPRLESHCPPWLPRSDRATKALQPDAAEAHVRPADGGGGAHHPRFRPGRPSRGCSLILREVVGLIEGLGRGPGFLGLQMIDGLFDETGPSPTAHGLGRTSRGAVMRMGKGQGCPTPSRVRNNTAGSFRMRARGKREFPPRETARRGKTLRCA